VQSLKAFRERREYFDEMGLWLERAEASFAIPDYINRLNRYVDETLNSAIKKATETDLRKQLENERAFILKYVEELGVV
jgi:hypothetical protein